MENSLYVRQNKTGSNRDVKILIAEYCLCGWWVVLCLVLFPLYPRVDLRQMFHKCLSGNFQQVSTYSGMWSVSKEWKVQCLNRKISGYSESDKTGMACSRFSWVPWSGATRKNGLFKRKACEIGQNNIMSLGRPVLPPASGCFGWTCRYYLQMEKNTELELVELQPSPAPWAGPWLGTQYKPSSHIT